MKLERPRPASMSLTVYTGAAGPPASPQGVVDVSNTDLIVLGKIDPKCTTFLARVRAGAAASMHACMHVCPCSVTVCGSVAVFGGPAIPLMQGNRVTMVQGLDPLSQLTSIDLSHNRLILLDPVHRAAALTALDVEANFLNDVQLACLRQLTRLTSLNIAGNSITTLAPLRELRGLTSLRVSRNALRSLVRARDAAAATAVVVVVVVAAAAAAAVL